MFVRNFVASGWMVLALLGCGSEMAASPEDPPHGSIGPVCNGKCDMPTSSSCTRVDETICHDGGLYTCKLLPNGTLSLGAVTACESGSCLDATACNSCQNECEDWGARCNGSVLETCVVGKNGCRTLLTETCSTGCQDGSCRSCDAALNPRLGSVLDNRTGYYKDIALRGNRILAAFQQRDGIYWEPNAGIASIDVSNPSAMAGSISVTAPNDSVSHLQRVGDRLYFVDGRGLEVFDARDAAQIQPMGTYPWTHQQSPRHDLSVSGTLACLALEAGLQLIDVTDGQNPALLSTYDPGFAPRMVVCTGEVAALAGADSLQIVDLRDPLHPVKMAETAIVTPMLDKQMLFDGSLVFLTTDNSGWSSLSVFRFEAPNQLTRLAEMKDFVSTKAMLVNQGNLFYTTSDSVGMLDVANPAAPVWKKHFPFEDAGSGLAFNEGVLFASGNGVTAFDPARAPELITRTVSKKRLLTGYAPLGSLAVLAMNGDGLVIEDQRDPAKPVVLSQTSMNVSGLVVSEHFAYVAHTDDRGAMLTAFDISSPWHPVKHATSRVPRSYYSDYHNLKDLRLSGRRIYGNCTGNRVCVFDIHEPETPRLASQTPVVGLSGVYLTAQFAMRDQHMFYLDSYQNRGFMRVQDWTDPSGPEDVASLPLPDDHTGDSGEIVVDGSLAVILRDCWLYKGDLCLHTVDVSTPSAPVMLGSVTINAHYQEGTNIPRQWRSFVVGGNRAYIANRGKGVMVVDLSVPTNPRLMTEIWTRQTVNQMYSRGPVLSTSSGPLKPSSWGAEYVVEQPIQMCAGE